MKVCSLEIFYRKIFAIITVPYIEVWLYLRSMQKKQNGESYYLTWLTIGIIGRTLWFKCN